MTFSSAAAFRRLRTVNLLQLDVRVVCGSRLCTLFWACASCWAARREGAPTAACVHVRRLCAPHGWGYVVAPSTQAVTCAAFCITRGFRCQVPVPWHAGQGGARVGHLVPIHARGDVGPLGHAFSVCRAGAEPLQAGACVWAASCLLAAWSCPTVVLGQAGGRAGGQAAEE